MLGRIGSASRPCPRICSNRFQQSDFVYSSIPDVYCAKRMEERQVDVRLSGQPLGGLSVLEGGMEEWSGGMEGGKEGGKGRKRKAKEGS